MRYLYNSAKNYAGLENLFKVAYAMLIKR